MNRKSFEPSFPTFKPVATHDTKTGALWSGGSAQRTSLNFLSDGGFPNFGKTSNEGMAEHHTAQSGLAPSMGSHMLDSAGSPPRSLKSAFGGLGADSARLGVESQQQSFSGVRGLLPDDPGDSTYDVEFEESAEDVIEGLKLQIEALITAITLKSTDGESSSNAKSDYFLETDAVEIAHRIMCRLRLLREENDRLGQLTAGTHAAKLEAQNRELGEENRILRGKLIEMQRVRKIPGS